jgi:hypothetical protein
MVAAIGATASKRACLRGKRRGQCGNSRYKKNAKESARLVHLISFTLCGLPMPGEQGKENCRSNHYGHHENNQYKPRDAHRPPTGSLPRQDSMRPASSTDQMPIPTPEIAKVSNGQVSEYLSLAILDRGCTITR